jgi:hypothetical protein
VTVKAFRGGELLMSGRHARLALASVRAAIDAQRRTGLPLPVEVLELAEELALAVERDQATSGLGTAEVPEVVGVQVSLAEDLIDVREAASMLGCSDRNVRSLLAREVLTTGRRLAGSWVVERAEVLARVERLAS